MSIVFASKAFSFNSDEGAYLLIPDKNQPPLIEALYVHNC